MIKKSVSIAVLAALAAFAATPAFALNNPGFEAGLGANPTGWVTPGGALTSVVSGTTVHVIDDAYYPTPTEIYSTAVTAMSGNNFGLLETCPAGTPALSCATTVSFSFNLGGPVSNYGDLLWMRLFTAEYLPANYNDSVSVSYFGASSLSALATDTISVQSMEDAGINTDSGWQGFAVPVGTQSLMLQLNNVAVGTSIPSDAFYNRPIAALDYQAAVTPVPEAETSAMMLAGLGLLGLVARRRKSRVAK
ncbi:PEP-CTERM sorting domain-containing protein [uncultured Sphaerotilus sp.]|uniref:PEP-CTERM sorting domain-containing protein n=1 Tax=uncultured Sphaerotilus sp. TaxID=474984 RepID=UPI0030CA134C